MNEFLQMGGYAVYVWGSFGAGVCVFGWNLWSVRAQQRDFRRRARAADAGARA